MSSQTPGTPSEKRRSDLGEKRFHSETSLHHMASAAEDEDPGVYNPSSRRPSIDYLSSPRTSFRSTNPYTGRHSRRPSVDFILDQDSRHGRERSFSHAGITNVFRTAASCRANRMRQMSLGYEVFNSTPNVSEEARARRRRTVSQPGPPGTTATFARARRKPRSVMYADQLGSPRQQNREGDDKLSLRLAYPGAASHDSGTATPTDTRGSPLQNGGNFAQGDSRSLNSYRMFVSSTEPAGHTRKRSITEVQSIRSLDTLAPPPTPAEEKNQMTKNYLTVMLSVMYAILLVTLGTIIFVSDPFLEDMSISSIYCLYLVGVGFLYLAFLMIDIRIYMNKSLQNDKLKEKHLENYEDYYKKNDFEAEVDSAYPDGTPHLPPPPPPHPPLGLKPLDHRYCFSHGRHAGSFYLKMGAAGFALGHMVHSVLLLASQLGYLLGEGFEDCIEYPQIVLDIVYPVYSFTQLFFIFKYSNVIILRHQVLARFGFMHFIGSSLCFWVWTICRETVLTLIMYVQSKYGSDYGNYNSASVSNYSRLALEDLIDENCMDSAYMNTVISNFSPYLFPFSVEYNILIVAIFYIIWSNIGTHPSDEEDDISSVYSGETTCKMPQANAENGYASNFIIHADCHASNRGIFGGLVVVVLTLALIILTFIFARMGTEEFLEVGHILNDSTKLGLHAVMLIAVVVAYNRTTNLDVNQHPVSLLDDILLFVCVPAFFMETIFTMVATVNIVNIIKFVDVTVMTIQIIIQTSFLVDALRRCSNSRRLRRIKPGRELVMFLLITNVAMWLFNTFSYKSPDSVDERYEYYGKVLWSILGHISLPLIMFYRFHSSVCLADIWKSAYEPGSGH